MAKKRFKDYTPEQKSKLERRYIRLLIKKKPEEVKMYDKALSNMFTETAKARQEAIVYDAKDTP